MYITKRRNDSSNNREEVKYAPLHDCAWWQPNVLVWHSSLEVACRGELDLQSLFCKFQLFKMRSGLLEDLTLAMTWLQMDCNSWWPITSACRPSVTTSCKQWHHKVTFDLCMCRYNDEFLRQKQEFEAKYGSPKTSKPKAPSSYNKFVKANYPAAKKSTGDPKLAFAEVAKQWKGLSDAEKKKYGWCVSKLQNKTMVDYCVLASQAFLFLVRALI